MKEEIRRKSPTGKYLSLMNRQKRTCSTRAGTRTSRASFIKRLAVSKAPSPPHKWLVNSQHSNCVSLAMLRSIGLFFKILATEYPHCTIAGSGSWLARARANGEGAQCCSYNTHHHLNQPHQAIQSKHSPDGAARARKQTSDTAYYSDYRPRKDERLSRPGWLFTYRNEMPPPGVEPGHVTYPSTNRARRRVTSLIRPTPLPLCHAAKYRGILSVPSALPITELYGPCVEVMVRVWHCGCVQCGCVYCPRSTAICFPDYDKSSCIIVDRSTTEFDPIINYCKWYLHTVMFYKKIIWYRKMLTLEYAWSNFGSKLF